MKFSHSIKWLILAACVLLSLPGMGQWPDNPLKTVLGKQTTGQGLIYYGTGFPSYSPSSDEDSYHFHDTTNNVFYFYNRVVMGWDTVQAGGGGGGGDDGVVNAIVFANDSLRLSRTQSLDSLRVDLSALNTDTAFIRSEISDSLATITTFSGEWGSLTGIPALLDLDSTDNVQWTDTATIVATLTNLADTAAAIRADFPTGFSGAWGDLTGIPALLDLDSTDNVQWTDTTTIIVTATTLADTAGAVRDDIINSAAFSGTTTKTLTLTTPNGDITAQFTDATGAPGTSDGVVDGASLSNDSLVLTRTESLGTLRVDLSSFNTDTTFIRSEISDSIATITTFSGAYGDLTGVPADIDTDATDDINWSDTTSLISTLTNLADTSAAIRADFPDVSSFIDTESDPVWISDSSTYAAKALVADTAAAIRADFPSGSGSTNWNDLTNVPPLLDIDSTDNVEWGDTTSLIVTLTNLADSTAAVRSDFPTDTDTQLSQEQVEDLAGSLFTGNTETLISSVYNDASGSVTLTVEDDLSLYDNSTSDFIDGTELADTAAAIRADFPDVSGFIDTELDPVWISDSSTYAAKSLVADTAAAIRADFPSGSGSTAWADLTGIPALLDLDSTDNVEWADTTTLIATQDDIANFITSPDDADADAANEGILGVTANSTYATLTSNTTGANGVTFQDGLGMDIIRSTSSNGGTISYNIDLGELTPSTLFNDSDELIWLDGSNERRGTFSEMIGDLNIIQRTELADTASAIRADFPTGGGISEDTTLFSHNLSSEGNRTHEIDDDLFRFNIQNGGRFIPALMDSDSYFEIGPNGETLNGRGEIGADSMDIRGNDVHFRVNDSIVVHSVPLEYASDVTTTFSGLDIPSVDWIEANIPGSNSISIDELDIDITDTDLEQDEYFLLEDNGTIEKVQFDDLIDNEIFRFPTETSASGNFTIAPGGGVFATIRVSLTGAATTHNVTMSTTGIRSSNQFTIHIVNDGTGTHTVSFPSSVLNGDASTQVSDIDLDAGEFVFIPTYYDGTNFITNRE